VTGGDSTPAAMHLLDALLPLDSEKVSDAKNVSRETLGRAADVNRLLEERSFQVSRARGVPLQGPYAPLPVRHTADFSIPGLKKEIERVRLLGNQVQNHRQNMGLEAW